MLKIILASVVLLLGVSACSVERSPLSPVIGIRAGDDPCVWQRLIVGLHDAGVESEQIAKKNFAKKNFAKKKTHHHKSHVSHSHSHSHSHHSHSHHAHVAPTHTGHAPVSLTGPPGCG